jgi:CheY-like chemotaxis protein
MLDVSVEQCLRVGNRVVVNVNPQAANGFRVRSRIRGWSTGEAIMLDRTLTKDQAVRLRPQMKCVVEFVHDGSAFAMLSTMLDVAPGRDYFTVNWPTKAERATVRRNERVKISAGCDAALSDGTRVGAQLRDISLGGFGLLMDTPLAEGTNFQVTLDLPGGFVLSGLSATVRNVRTMTDSTFVGCVFTDLSEEEAFDLEYFVTSSLDRVHHQSAADDQLLVISDDLEFIAALRVPLEDSGITVAAAPTVMDGFCRIRLRMPELIVVKLRLPDLSGTEVCRMIRTTRGCGSVPVIIYGDENAKARASAVDAGAEGFYTTAEQVADAAQTIL